MTTINTPQEEEAQAQKKDSVPDSQEEEGELPHIPSERQVKQILWHLGVPVYMRGYPYLKSAILHVMEHSKTFYLLTKDIYPTVAKEYGSTSSCVERDIRYVIAATWERGGREEWNAIHGFSAWRSTGRPTNREFIAMIVDYLPEQHGEDAGRSLAMRERLTRKASKNHDGVK